MNPLLAAKVWHYWVAFPLLGGAILGLIAFGIGYLVKVTSARYPRR
jgi:hypothetical protein